MVDGQRLPAEEGHSGHFRAFQIRAEQGQPEFPFEQAMPRMLGVPLLRSRAHGAQRQPFGLAPPSGSTAAPVKLQQRVSPATEAAAQVDR